MRQLIQQRKYFYVFSIAITVASIAMLSVWGLKLGIDFRGGTLLEVSWSEGKVPERVTIEEALKQVPRVESLVVQPSGERNTLIRYASSDETVNEAVFAELKKTDEKIELIRSEFIGASVSGSIKKNAIIALILAVIGIILYIAWAFRGVSRPVSSWHYGIQATVALAHDIVITLGVFSFLGKFYGIEVGAPFIAALLTILGYSVNDTIVVYDRIRENLIRSGGKEDFEEVVNHSLNQTIARSFNTSFTVIIVLIAISIFGGESIRSFAVALLVGVSAGTYSSIYIATALLVSGNNFQKNRARRKSEASLGTEKRKEKQEKKREQSESVSEEEMRSLGIGESALGSAPVLSETARPSVSSQKNQKSKKRKKKGRRR